MTTPTSDGGPAFPIQETDRTHYIPGMSLRDYFAAQALTGIMTMISTGAHSVYSQGELGRVGGVAFDAYRLADAMLSERAKATGAKP